MNIFKEIWTGRISRRVINWIQTPAAHERPQDDVPDETILRHLYADYRKMLAERLALISYIRKQEHIYKKAQAGLVAMAADGGPWDRKLMVKKLRKLSRELTWDYIAAQQKLRKTLEGEQAAGKETKQEEGHDTIDEE